jgi:hypothetical protein
MATAAQRMYYAMLSGVTLPPVSGDCLPYTMPSYDAANENLDRPLSLTARDAANVNLCEELL